MKIPRLRLLGSIALALALAAPPASAQSGEDLFQRALVLERSNGEVREAIQLYQRIVRDFASDRALAARALLRLGMAHEILGHAEARSAYERLVADFADQASVVSQARVRLGSLPAEAEAAVGTEISRVLFDDPLGCAVYAMRPSPNGRRLAYADVCGGGALVVRDLATGEEARYHDDGWYSTPTWSRDGRRLMSIRSGGTEEKRGIRILDASTGADVTPEGVAELEITPIDWSPDGEHIAGLVVAPDRSGGAAVASLETGSIIQLTQRMHQGTDFVRISPDGRSLVFVDYVGDQLDLFTSAVDGSRRIRLTSTSEEERYPFWSPEGDRVIYQASNGLWALDLREGRVTRGPYAVRSGTLDYPVDWLQSGLYFVKEDLVHEAIELPVDPRSGRRVGDAVPMPGIVEGALWMAWSPDGSRLAMAGWDQKMKIYSSSNGAVTEYPMGPEFLPSHVWWSGDGSEILFTTAPRARRDKRSTIFAMDPADGTVREMFERLEDVHHLHASPDGTKMAFITNLLDRSQMQELVVADMGRRDGMVIGSGPAPEGNMSTRFGQPLFSPDGSMILFLRGARPGPSVWVASSDGTSPPRRLAHAPGGYFTGVKWSPDSRFVAIAEVDQETEEVTIYTVSIEDGNRVDLMTSRESATAERTGELTLKYWSPDGRSIGLVRSTGTWELRVANDIAASPGGAVRR